MKKLIKKIKNYIYSHDSDLTFGVLGIFGSIYVLVNFESRFWAFYAGFGFLSCGYLILSAIYRSAKDKAADRESHE